MREDHSRKQTIIVNHYVREDQYEWLRKHSNHSVVMRELIDAAMYDSRFLTGAQLAKMHRAVKELEEVLEEVRRATEGERERPDVQSE